MLSFGRLSHSIRVLGTRAGVSPALVFASPLSTSFRCASVAAFHAAIEKLQAEQRSLQSNVASISQEQRQSQLQEIQRQGKKLFDTDKLEGVDIDLNPETAAAIAQAAAQWRVSALRGQPYTEVLRWSCSEKAEKSMNILSLARILHSALVLRAPQLYPLLLLYIPLVRGSLSYHAVPVDPVTLAVLINAYGRAEVHHPGLYQVLCERAVKSLEDPSLPLAHITNVAHALSKVQVRNPAVLATLRDQAVRQKASASALMSITILDAFAALEFVDNELFTLYEAHLLEQMKTLSPPLLGSLLNALVNAGRAQPSPLLTAIGEHIQHTAASFDAYSIAKVISAYFASGQFSEDVFGALAERACSVISDFRAGEVTSVLEALSAFDLFDGELFPLLAGRLAMLIKQGSAVAVEDAASALASFAAVQEPNDELHHWCAKVFQEYADARVSAEAYINIIWSCLGLNIRNEGQQKFIEAVKANPKLLDLPEELLKKHHKKTILEERRVKISKAYGITLSA